ncbi:MAG: hypothetical protein Q9163_001567 [Psora crenata]
MPPPQQSTLISPTELAYLHSSLLLSPPIRPDARSPTTFRPLIAETDLLPSANGSARLCFADGMEGIVGVKVEVERTKAAGRGKGPMENAAGEEDDIPMGGVEGEGYEGQATAENEWAEVTIDMPGQRDDDSMVIFLAQMIHEGLVADGMLPRRLYINRNWHWKLYIDILLLSPPATYPLPLLSLSTHLALLSTHLPSPISTGDEDPLFNDDWDAAEPLYQSTNGKQSDTTRVSKPPVTLLVVSVGDNIFFDPSREELAVADAVVAVTITSSSQSGAIVLAVRTVDAPSRLSPSPAAALGKELELVGEDKEDEGEWKPRRGGVKRTMLAEIVRMCAKPGGIGEEVLGGLQRFT